MELVFTVHKPFLRGKGYVLYILYLGALLSLLRDPSIYAFTKVGSPSRNARGKQTTALAALGTKLEKPI